LGGAIVRQLKGADATVEDLAFSPDGSAIAAGTLYNGIYLWNLEAAPPSPVRVPCDEGYRRGGLSFSSDGRAISWFTTSSLRRSYDRDTHVTDTVNTFATANTFANLAAQERTQTADGSLGISRHGFNLDRLFGWRLADDTWVQTWSHSIADRSVDRLTLSADGRLFAMLTRSTIGEGWDKNPFKLEVRENTTAAPLKGIGEYPYKYGDQHGGRLLFSPDRSQLVGFNNMNLLVWSVPESGKLVAREPIRNTTRKHFTAIAYHPSGRQLYVTSNGESTKDATIHVFDTSTWTRVEQFNWKLGNMKTIAISPDGTLAAAGGERGDIVIWDVDL
jgi:WD40 repeat protein